MSRPLLATLLAGMLTLANALAQKPRPDASGKPPAAPAAVVDGEVGRALDAALQGFDADAGGFCGVALVAVKGKVLLDKGYGIADAAANKPMPANALFDQASVSKQFTAAAVLRLIEASRLKDNDLARLKPKKLADNLKKWRKLGLDDPLSRFFPDAPKDKAAVTLRQLLNHTSGIEAGFKGGWKFDARDRESFVKMALQLPMTSKPGDKWEYSNSGYALVAAILERVTGLSFEEYCVEYVFRPAGMKEATLIGFGALEPGKAANALDRVPKVDRGAGFTDRQSGFHFAYGDQLNWGYRGCGGVVATTRDMLAWDRALRDRKFLGTESIDALYQPALQNYALGWEVRKTNDGVRVEHSGGVQGVVTYYLRSIDADVVVAIACSYRPKGHPGQLADKLLQIAKKG